MMLLDDGGTPTRLIRNYLQAPGEKEVPPVEEPEAATRFLGPYQFNASQRQEFEVLFERHGLGDEEGRRIFLLAVEYAIAGLEELVQPEPAPSSPQEAGSPSALAELARVAGHLADLLERLSPEEKEEASRQLTELDPFKRNYGPHYFDILCEESRRLAGLTLPQSPAAPRPEGAPKPARRRLSSRSSFQFLTLLADAYADCFETLPTAEPEGAFMELLEAVSKSADLPLTMDRDLILSAIDAVAD